MSDRSALEILVGNDLARNFQEAILEKYIRMMMLEEKIDAATAPSESLARCRGPPEGCLVTPHALRDRRHPTPFCLSLAQAQDQVPLAICQIKVSHG